MLQEQVVPVNFGQGVDTKTDSKAVVAGRFLRLENAVFTNINRIAKRNGYGAITINIAGGGTLSAPQMVHSFKNELICQEGGNLYAYSPTLAAWVNRGRYVSTEVSRTSIDQEHPVSGYTDCAVLGNYALYVYSTACPPDGSSASDAYLSVVDTQSGTILLQETIPSSELGSTTQANPVRAVTLGGTVLAVAYVNSAANAVTIRVISISGTTVSLGAAQSINNNLSVLQFDIMATATGAAVAYLSSFGVNLVTLNTSGAVSNSLSAFDASATLPVSLCIGANGNIWVYWTEEVAGASCSIYYAIFSSALSPVLTKTLVKTLGGAFLVTNMTAFASSNTQQILYFGELAGNASIGFVDQTSYVTASSGGSVGVSAIFANGVAPWTHPFSIGSSNYAVFLYRGGALGANDVSKPYIQPTYFVVDLSTSQTIPYVVARFGAGVANHQAMLPSPMAYTPSAPLFSSTKALFACAIETQEFNSDSFEQPKGSPGGIAGAFSYGIDFASADAYTPTNSGGLAALNGGVIQGYDGDSVTELNYHLFPEITNIAQTGSGGHIAAAAYSYLAIFQWTDAQGSFHQSTPSDPYSITVTNASTTNTITVTAAFLSQKIGVSVTLFRTIGAGSTYFQVSDPVFLPSASAQSSAQITLTDILADSTIQGNPGPYTFPGSSVLENTVPPPSMAMVTHNNRLQFRDDENRNTYWYTKSFQPGTGLSPSGFMTTQLDPKFGDISAMAEMDDKLVAFKANGFLAISGDGVNDAGSGSSLSFPQSVPSDVGCTVMRSVVLTPKGIMFKSTNGIYILDRSLNVSYIGAEVEAYNSQVITGANLVPGKSQIRFLCSSGLTLVYDYIFSQWSTFTNHSGVSSSTWNNTYLYSNGNVILQESAGVYNDNGVGFSLLAQTSWLALASIQGFQRVKRLIMLGDFVNGNSSGHSLSIQLAYDFVNTFQPMISYAFGATSASGVFQYRERLPRQKCDSVSLLIQETTTGSSAEYIDLTNISFEAGVKRGVNKLGGAYSVG